MAKVDGSISSLIQGVSQQPARERLAGQGELQENCTSDVVNGLARRGPTQDIAELINSGDNWTFQDHDAGSQGHYVIGNKANEVKVFDLDGTEYTVTVDGTANTYIPDGAIEIESIEDDIFLLDKSKTVTTLPDVQDSITDGSLVFLLGGQYGRTYKVTITYGSTTIIGEYTTPDGSAAVEITALSTDWIMDRLLNGGPAFGDDSVTPLVDDVNFTTNFDYELVSDVLYIIPKSASGITDYTVSVTDGDGGSNIFVVKKEIDDVGDLPRYAPHGFTVKVSEGANSNADDWYLEFSNSTEGTALGDGFGTDGVWIETTEPDAIRKLDPATMPHVLTKTGPTAFTLKQGTWEDRRVGDDTTNPLPSFVDNPINSISSFQGRLAFTSDVYLILSRSDKPFDFFRQSATALADSDPIDIRSALGTFVMRKMVAHNRDLVIFSDKAQFILFGRNVITPKNSSLVLTTEFETSLDADPVAAGRNIFFTFAYGTFTGVQEFFTEGSEDINDARPITLPVSKYIEGTANKLTSTTNFNKLLVSTSADAKTLYLYEYIWVNREKAQSSWSKWLFSHDTLHSFFVDNLLYLVQQTGTSYRLKVLDLDDTPSTDTGYRVMLDDRIEASSVNTTFTVPYPVDDINDYVVVQGEGCPYVGMRANIASYNAGIVTLTSDMQGGKVYFGRKYRSRYEPTSPFVRDREGVKVGSGKLIIKSYQVYFNNTGYFDALITDDFGYSAKVTYNGRTLGAPTNLVGQPAIVDGSFNVPCKKNADTSQLEITSDSHLPFYLLEMEWLGQWTKKGKRITGG